MTALYVLTCRRETDDPWEYMLRTLEQVDAEELDVPKLIFCDGVYDAPEPSASRDHGWDLVEWERPAGALRGNKLPYSALLGHALRAGHDDVLVLEDDLTCCRNALRRMVTFPTPSDLAWVQFFAPIAMPARQMLPGLWRPPLGTSLHAQAIKFPRRTLERLADWSSADQQFALFSASDQMLARFAQRCGLRYGVHCPELVQHAGAVSAAQSSDVELDEGRVAQTWPGKGFDALTLYGRDDLYR